MSTREYHVTVDLLDSCTGKLKKTIKKKIKATNECEAIGIVVQQVKATHDGFFYCMKFPKIITVG
jgi:hypothetical protein